MEIVYRELSIEASCKRQGVHIAGAKEATRGTKGRKRDDHQVRKAVWWAAAAWDLVSSEVNRW